MGRTRQRVEFIGCTVLALSIAAAAHSSACSSTSTKTPGNRSTGGAAGEHAVGGFGGSGALRGGSGGQTPSGPTGGRADRGEGPTSEGGAAGTDSQAGAGANPEIIGGNGGAGGSNAADCGDGTVTPPNEECDDGNLEDGDGCSSCAIEPGFSCAEASACEDIDECASATDDCGANEVCTNTPGGFTCECAAGYTRRAARCIEIFQVVPGSLSTVSDDGTVAAGFARQDTGLAARPARWTEEGMELLQAPGEPVDGGLVLSANADGSVLVGHAALASGGGAFRWTPSTGIVAFGLGSTSLAQAVSANGETVTGRLIASQDPLQINGFRWTAATMTREIGILGALGDVKGLSGDGAIAVGSREVEGAPMAFRWSNGTGFQNIGPAGVLSYANAISADGRVTVGYTLRLAGTAQMSQAFRHVANRGLEDLPTGSLTGTRANDVNRDGTVIIGTSDQGAWIWDETHGARLLADLLSERGLDLSGWSSLNALATSGDGKVIVGNGSLESTFSGWIARLE